MSRPGGRIKVLAAPELEGPKTRPPCPKHGGRMAYSPEKGAWVCSVDGCKMVAHPSTDMGDKPVVGKGALTLIYDASTKQAWIKADNNVLINVTDYIESFAVTVKSYESIAEIGLLFTNIIDVNEV